MSVGSIANFEAISANIHFIQNVSSQAPLGQFLYMIPIFYSELNENYEKNMFFYISSPQGGGV